MTFVLDASATTCWAFEDEEHPAAAIALSRMASGEAIVPGLWWFEVRNILVVNERRGRISEQDSGCFLREISRLRIRVDRDPEEAAVLRLARAHRLSVYDAAYLELALRERIALATLDNQLREAAAAEGAELL